MLYVRPTFVTFLLFESAAYNCMSDSGQGSITPLIGSRVTRESFCLVISWASWKKDGFAEF